MMTGGFHSDNHSAGSVLIVVLIVCLGLVSLTIVLSHSMILAYRGSDNELAGRQADMAIEGAAQYAEAVMTNVATPGEMPDLTTYQYDAVPLGDATFWFIGEPDPTDTSNNVAFGLIDEASKLNLNTATATMLENLPGMTQELAEAIVQWRTVPNTSGSSTSSSSSASSTDTVKQAPFESPEELAQVDGGVDLDTLYGSDLNLNHVLDPNESNTALTFTPGLMEYVTVFSRQPNVLTDRTTKRLNVTTVSGSLTTMLTSALGSARSQQITQALTRAGTIRSVLEFYEKSGMTADEFASVSGSIGMSNNQYSPGLVNVNTASQTVLECIPGISESAAAQIVTTRSSQTTPITNLSWVAPILTGTSATQAGPYLTAETWQVTADIAATGKYGRGYRRTLFVIDNSSGTPQIVYRRNLSSFGWALGAAARESGTGGQASGTPAAAKSGGATL